MIDKKTEGNIKEVKAFLEIWEKFHSLYADAISKERIADDDEKKFLETKALVRDKYGFLKDRLEFKYMPHSRFTDPVNEILDLNTIRFMAEKNLKKLNNDWDDSYIFLNNILERLQSKKRRLEVFNPLGVFLKRFFERK